MWRAWLSLSGIEGTSLKAPSARPLYAQARRGRAAPIAMNTPPQALLKLRPTRDSQGLISPAALAKAYSVSTSVATKVPAMIRNWVTRLRSGWMNCGRNALNKRLRAI